MGARGRWSGKDLRASDGLRRKRRSPRGESPAVAPATTGAKAKKRAAAKLELAVVTSRPLESLRLNPSNARTHSKKQVAQIAASIREFGFNNPVLIDDSCMIIAGHGRVEAAKLLGWTQVPTIQLDHLSREQIRAYVLADNRLAERASWDPEILRLEFAALSRLELSFDLEITGFDTVDIDRVMNPDTPSNDDPADSIPDLDETSSISQLGDLWELGPHRLLCQSALETESYARLLASESAQMVFTDPPYNVPIAGHVSGLGKVHHREFVMGAGELSQAGFTEFLFRFLAATARHSVDGAILYVCMDWRHLSELQSAAQRAGLEVKNLCVWSKDNAGMGSFYRSQHELIFVLKSGSAPHINNFGLGQDGRYRTNVWYYPGVNSFQRGRDADLAMHPTVKPVALVADAIKDCSRQKVVVLDPFAGSGTTIIAADRTGRVARAIELDPHYVDVILKRWEAFSGTPARLALTGQTFAAVAAARMTPAAETARCDRPTRRRWRA